MVALSVYRPLTRSLPERRHHIFVLYRQHGLTYREIATLLSISPATVETQVGRALKTITFSPVAPPSERTGASPTNYLPHLTAFK